MNAYELLKILQAHLDHCDQLNIDPTLTLNWGPINLEVTSSSTYGPTLELNLYANSESA